MVFLGFLVPRVLSSKRIQQYVVLEYKTQDKIAFPNYHKSLLFHFLCVFALVLFSACSTSFYPFCALGRLQLTLYDVVYFLSVCLYVSISVCPCGLSVSQHLVFLSPAGYLCV